MLGQISLDDYELKIHRLLRHSKHRKDILTLPKGVFLYTPLDKLVKFDKFKQSGKPYPAKPKPKPLPQTQTEEPQKKRIVQKIMSTIFPEPQSTEPQFSERDTEEERERDFEEEEEEWEE